MSVTPLPNHLVMWAGDTTPKELDQYIAENYPFGSSGPRSFFAADIMYWYDPDYLVCHASETPTGLDHLMTSWGFTDEGLIAEAVYRCPEEVSGFILLWNYTLAHDGPVRPILKGKLACLGSWPHKSPFD